MNIPVGQGKEAILCSACFDALKAERVIEIIPLSVCEQCGKLCLGYQTEVNNPVIDTEVSNG